MARISLGDDEYYRQFPEEERWLREFIDVSFSLDGIQCRSADCFSI
jgi:hypothetical protein